MEIKARIKQLRQSMKDTGISAYIIPSNDPHLSEYVSLHWQLREWISGFTGSAGTVIIGKKQAGLWTDGRYYTQAQEELKGTGIQLMKVGLPKTPTQITWLQNKLKKGDKVGIASILSTQTLLRQFSKALKTRNITIIGTKDLINGFREIKDTRKNSPVFHLTDLQSGRNAKDKIKALRRRIKSAKAEALFISALDEIAWLTNLRGADVDFNPVFYSYMWLDQKQAILFTNKGNIEKETLAYIESLGIKIQAYNQVFAKIKTLSDGKLVMVDPNNTNRFAYNSLNAKVLIERPSPIRIMKARKNAVERRNAKEVMIKDGIALTRTFMWLNSTLKTRAVSEFELGEKIAVFRSRQEGYKGESFSAIVGFKGNGAIIHYRADEKTCKQIEGDGMLLVDSGGQYLEGTTDITRTFYFGNPTAEHKEHYTRVLKGHIALAKARFPLGTKGVQLDILARQFLWENGLNYNHGTGHGVGHFLNVHEPPQGIAPDLRERGITGFSEGMLTSNEPGFYKVDQYGIRIENLVLSVEDKEGDFGQFLRFDTITLFPFSKNLMDRNLLTDSEVSWINSYHKKVFVKLAARLREGEKNWLEARCSPLQ